MPKETIENPTIKELINAKPEIFLVAATWVVHVSTRLMGEAIRAETPDHMRHLAYDAFLDDFIASEFKSGAIPPETLDEFKRWAVDEMMPKI